MMKIHIVLGFLLSCGIFVSNANLQYSEKNANVNETAAAACECGSMTESCIFVGDEKTCTCAEGFSLNAEGICAECECGPKSETCKFVGNEKACTCAGGFSQNAEGICAACECGPNTESCKFVGDEKMCICLERFSLNKEGICVVSCNSTADCPRFRKCTQLSSGEKLCRCLPGKTGEQCERDMEECVTGKYKTCKGKGGRCIYNDEKQIAECHCEPGDVWYEGQFSQYCRTICDNNCANYGQCKDTGVGKFCECKRGLSGHLCERVDECERGYCGTNTTEVTCVYDLNRDGGKCVCADSTKLFYFNKGRCQVPCAGRSDPQRNCKHGGDCGGYRGGSFCKCKKGTSGDLCEIVDDCTENFCGKKTDVKCVYDAAKEAGTCKCDDPAELFDSNAKECRGWCISDDECESFEKCTKLPSGYISCRCLTGRSGEKCENIKDCNSGKYKSCRDGNGRCVYNKEKEMAECDCGAGKMWDDKTDRCRRSCDGDCANNGVCEGDGDAKFCKCAPGTEGDLCEMVKGCNKEEDLCGLGEDVKCVYDEKKLEGKCVCDNSTKLFDSDRKECRVPCMDDCANEGECLGVGEDKFCKCKPGTSGDLCTKTDDCAQPDFCGTKEDVKCVYEESTETSFCKCDNSTKRFDPLTKECRVPCKNTCDNNGKCEGEGEEMFCRCKPGTSGNLCTIVDHCLGQDVCGTKRDVQCVYDKRKESAICKCDDSRKSFDPKTKECRESCDSDSDCQNGAMCTGVNDGAKFCDCKLGTLGDMCEFLTECEMGGKYEHCRGDDGQCAFVNERVVCNCNHDKILDVSVGYCKIPCSDNCKNNGVCTNSAQHNFCVCKPGTSGDLCSKVDDCSKEDFCGRRPGLICVYNGINGGTCKCEDSAKQFDNIQNECRIPCKGDCDNNGKCAGEGEIKFCKCKPGTSGNLCTIVDHCVSQNVCGTKTDVKCVYNESKEAGYCKCDDPKKRFDPKSRECRVSCKNDCANNGKCEGDGEAKFCKCKPGTSGDQCTVVDDCASQNVCGRKTDVQCLYDESKEAGVCKCKDPKKSFDSKTKECRVPCHNDCHNKGVCDGGDDVKFCSCKVGTSGDHCATVDDCATGLCGENEGVKCVYDEIQKGGSCICHDTTKSFDSKTKECRKESICADHTCYNGGVCMEDVAGTPRCYCKAPFSGERCEKEESICADYTCHNGGVCIEDADGTPRCYCKAPFSGERCEKDPCSTNPCKNEGICEVKGGAYNCICKEQFWGKTCEMDPCTPNPCQNGGTCNVNGMMFKCTCKKLFTGSTCEMDISDNRFISSAVLFVIVLLTFVLMCYGCCFFRINQKFRPACESSEACRHSCERKKRDCV